MPNPYNKNCNNCGKVIPEYENRAKLDNETVCINCYNILKISPKKPGIDPDELRKMIDNSIHGKVYVNSTAAQMGDVTYNKPEHYHTHDIDTIEFLKRGFPPQVLTGFLIGNIIKYTQRFEYKNGEEDVLKIVDYAKRLQEWYKETHS